MLKNKNGFIAIETVIVGALIIVLGFFIAGNLKETNAEVATKTNTNINKTNKSADASYGTTAEKHYEETPEEDKTQAEKDNAILVNPNTDEYADLNSYRNNQK